MKIILEASKQTDLRSKHVKKKKLHVRDVGTRTTYEYSYIIFRTKTWSIERLGHFLGTHQGTREAEKFGAFVKRHTTKPFDVLNQDTSQLSPRRLPSYSRSRTLGTAPAQGTGIPWVETRGKLDPKITLTTKPSTAIVQQRAEPLRHGTDFSAMPFPYTTPMDAASSCSFSSMVWPPPWDDGSRCANLKRLRLL